MKTSLNKKMARGMKNSFFCLSVSILMLAISANSVAQDDAEINKAKHIIFTQPLGIFLKDVSLGYEYQNPKKLSFTLIVDAHKSLFTGDTFHVLLDKFSMYNGILIRPGIKFRTASEFSHSIEFYYKYSWYDHNFVLRRDYDGNAYDHYYLESKTCNSVGLSYKLSYDFIVEHFYFSPFINIGARLRFDDIIIYSKYEGGTLHDEYGLITDETEYTKEVWPIPIFRAGFIVGYRF